MGSVNSPSACIRSRSHREQKPEAQQPFLCIATTKMRTAFKELQQAPDMFTDFRMRCDPLAKSRSLQRQRNRSTMPMLLQRPTLEASNPGTRTPKGWIEELQGLTREMAHTATPVSRHISALPIACCYYLECLVEDWIIAKRSLQRMA
jgi:hypothetical protein